MALTSANRRSSLRTMPILYDGVVIMCSSDLIGCDNRGTKGVRLGHMVLREPVSDSSTLLGTFSASHSPRTLSRAGQIRRGWRVRTSVRALWLFPVAFAVDRTRTYFFIPCGIECKARDVRSVETSTTSSRRSVREERTKRAFGSRTNGERSSARARERLNSLTKNCRKVKVRSVRSLGRGQAGETKEKHISRRICH